MLVAVTTAKDTLANLERFVRRNLFAGIDHLVVFVDGEQPEVVERFAADPHVTCVSAWDDGWWGPEARPGLNGRQNRNAGVVNVVCTLFPWATWLFHVDADEVVHVNRRKLERLDPSCEVVLLRVLESVSHEDAEAEGGWFKRRLGPSERTLLVERGHARARTNSLYFRGHLTGKSGWRPSLDLRAAVHKPLGADGAAIDGLEAGWLRLLHLESPSAEEFARKWVNLAEAGLDTMAIRPGRRHVAAEVRALLDRGAPPDEVEATLAQVYDETIRDPFPDLRDLGLLVRVELDTPRYRPREVPAADLDRFRALVRGAAGLDKSGLLRTGRADVLGRIVEAVDG